MLLKAGQGQHDRVVATQTILPVLSEENRTAYEQWVATKIFEDLERHYPGHNWHVLCDLEKGGVAIGLPTLMAFNDVYWIRMRDLTPVQVARAGGELLERYRLPRGRFELGSFLEAREKHSILLDRRRKVPE